MATHGERVCHAESAGSLVLLAGHQHVLMQAASFLQGSDVYACSHLSLPCAMPLSTLYTTAQKACHAGVARAPLSCASFACRILKDIGTYLKDAFKKHLDVRHGTACPSHALHGLLIQASCRHETVLSARWCV